MKHAAIRAAAIALAACCLVPAAAAAARRPIAFVPLDDRPVTLQLPVMLGRIAGREVIVPPRGELGNYLTPGRPDAVIAWLNGPQARRARDFVLSTDMLAYGGLVASRVPGVRYQDAYFRLHEIVHLRAEHPDARIDAFATIMRLAPTGVPALGPAANYFAAYPLWQYVQQYANLHDPLLPSEEATAARLRALIGEPLLQEYLATRARDRDVDALVLYLTARGAIDHVVLGQDDAGRVGLHVADLADLKAVLLQYGLAGRASIEPGADELGMALVARTLAREADWTPRVAVRYSMPGGASVRDPLEYAPIGVTIGSLIRLCGGVRSRTDPDITLYVRVPNTDALQDDELLAAMRADVAARKPVAFVDLTFLQNTYAPQAAFAQRLLSDGLAGKLDAYASWNTDANSVGTALAEAIAAGAGRRMGSYDRLAQMDFTFDRMVDDYAFHDYVRPELDAYLDEDGIADHTYLLPPVAAAVAARNSADLWNRAESILHELYPGYHIAAIRIALPWNRTFETRIRVRLAPPLP